jgi:hypothetical protein
MNPHESAKTVAKMLELSFRRDRAEHADQLRLLEAAARCGALFAGREGASWGLA